MQQPTTLIWGIKDSLVTYIESLKDGDIGLEGDVERKGNEFYFSFDESSSTFDESTNEGTLQFSGTVSMSGYFGAMNIVVRDPRIILRGDRGMLGVVVESVFDEPRIDPVALISVTSVDPVLIGTTMLTNEGQMLFGPQYRPGQELSPITIQ